MRRALCLAVFLTLGCGDDPVRPSPPPPPACQANNTATLHFENRSRNGYTYDVWVDLARLTTVLPSQTSAPHIVAAGIQHSLVFTLTNVSTAVCFSTPVPAQCSTTTYFCEF